MASAITQAKVICEQGDEWGPSENDYFLMTKNGTLLISMGAQQCHVTALPDCSPALLGAIQEMMDPDSDDVPDMFLEAQEFAEVLENGLRAKGFC